MVLVAQWYRICLQCRRHEFDPWIWKIPWERNGHPLSILAWESPWTGEPGGLQFMGLQSWA